MIVAAIALLASGPAAETGSASPPPVPPSLARAKEQLTRCGLPSTRTSIHAERDPARAEIAIAAGPSLNRSEFACVARVSMDTLTYVEFEQADQDKEFRVVYGSLLDAAHAQQYRDALAANGLLNKVPVFNPQRQSLASYGRSLEALCGIQRGRVLTVRNDALALRPELDAPHTGKLFGGAMTGGQFGCLLLVSDNPSLGDHELGQVDRTVVPVNQP